MTNGRIAAIRVIMMPRDTNAFGTFFRAMLERGVYLPPSQFEAWFLSGAHTRQDIQRTIKAAREAMAVVRKTPR